MEVFKRAIIQPGPPESFALQTVQEVIKPQKQTKLAQDENQLLENILRLLLQEFVSAALQSGEKVMQFGQSIDANETAQAHIPRLLDIVLYLCEKEHIEGGMIFQLLEDLTEMSTMKNCKDIFAYIESKQDILGKQELFARGKLVMLRTCNQLLRRLSKANDVVFCGRILMFLAHFFPLSERSALNIKGVFNTSNETKYEKEPLEGICIDFNFYETFWGLQEYFSNPASVIQSPIRWKKFTSSLSVVLNTFEAQPLSDEEGDANNLEEEAVNFSIKYLTSSKLMGLELKDPSFRRHVLVQCLILFNYLKAPGKGDKDFPSENMGFRYLPTTQSNISHIGFWGFRNSQLTTLVAENRCWSFGSECQSKHDLLNHLHAVTDFNDIKLLWDDDRYLKPFMQDDSLLYSFDEYEDGEDEQISPIDEDLVRDLKNAEEISVDGQDAMKILAVNDDPYDVCRRMETASVLDDHSNWASSSNKELINGKGSRECVSSIDKDPEEGNLMANSHIHIAKQIKKVNEGYFGSYSSFGIHREMLSDKARMDAYGQSILKNPSLLNGAVVMDVGCGTGILSLFAARAGASRVIAVEASAKMAAVASQVVKDNGLCLNKSQTGVNGNQKGVVEVVHGMVEEIDNIVDLQPHSLDVVLSEWMGYCLLYESMLGSVLYARDRWLKPGGAILPDTATIFVAGFGKGGTSLPFWENVCDFDMSCIGKELVTDAAQYPIVDVIEHQDLVTSSTILQTFDLATMKPDDVDFTATASLEPKLSILENEKTNLKSKTCCWCYGVVLWFDTGFTSRFCRETQAVLSTSPYTTKTHWSQTILTFREPIAIGFVSENGRKQEPIGTEAYPAVKIDLRVSIVRSTEHRSIDISMEVTGVGPDGQRRCWPAQHFSLQ